tara:strand:+ start:153 stop:824 length:672 start_codon:yes stop_codon:yes gene_type:complete
MKIIIIIISIFFLIGCQNNILKNIAKSDIDIVTEIHINNVKSEIEDLIIKLYKLNPVYIKRNEKFSNVSDVIIDIFKAVDIEKIDTTGQENIDLILKGFEEDFSGDRIYFITKGLYGMIYASYNYKEKFYLTDKKLSSQKLMNSSVNLKTLVWRLSNTKKNNTLLIKTNNTDGLKMNLSFERLFGKIINNQENMAKIISSQEGRGIQKVATNIVSTIFLPIGF